MHTFIIAEAGVNHNGNIDLAFELVDKAVEAGADAIKSQTVKADLLVSKNAAKAEYQKKTTDSEENQYTMLKKLEISFDDFYKIANYCKEKNIEFMSTPFDKESIDFLATIPMPYWKIPSGEITNYPYLKKMVYYKKNFVINGKV